MTTIKYKRDSFGLNTIIDGRKIGIRKVEKTITGISMVWYEVYIDGDKKCSHTFLKSSKEYITYFFKTSEK